MIKWLISFMMVCSLSVTVSACTPDDSPKKTENTVPEPEPNPDPTPEPITENGMFDLSKGENGNPPTIRLSSGYDMPIIGLGTSNIHENPSKEVVMEAAAVARETKGGLFAANPCEMTHEDCTAIFEKAYR